MTSEEDKRQKVQHYAQVYIWDFTYFGPKGEGLPEVAAFIKLLRPLFKKWVFQLESCPNTGRLHYQGRGSLFKVKRFNELCKLLNETPLRGMDVSESSNNSNANEIFYAMKYDTRKDGPWDNTTWKEPAYIPRQFRGLIDRMYPFQKSILDTRLQFNDRHVNVLIDTRGNNGKSTMACLAELHFGGIDLPPIGDHKELTQVVCNILMGKQCRDPGIVFVDLPRSLTLDPKKLGPFMIAIEQIKKGHVCDVRNHYTDWWFDSPAVWVCCNHAFETKFMSKDRWQFWTVSAMKTLVSLSFSQVEEMICDKS
jgi:hypothetical protein